MKDFGLIWVLSMDFEFKRKAFTLLEVLVAAMFTALVLGAALSALSASGFYFFRAHQRLLSLDEKWPELLSQARQVMANPEAREKYEKVFRFKELEIKVTTEEEEGNISVLRVEFRKYPFWFFVSYPLSPHQEEDRSQKGKL